MRPWICIAFLVLFHPLLSRAEATFRLSESSVNSEPSDWLGLDESQVFYRKLTHEGDGHSWTIKIGKGGQLYSMKIPELGELIALQRATIGQWVDEVYQHTLSMPPQKSPTNVVVDGDIHQAGYYTLSDLDNKTQLLPRSVYSPMFAYRYDPALNSVSYITWPQHAHLPRRYAENLLLINQTVTDLGEGVVEISVEFNKWGGARHERFDLPFSEFRVSTVPVHILSKRDGTYRDATQYLRDEKRLLRISEGSTGGWIAFADSNSPSGRGIGIVYGKDPRELDKKNGFVRWGYRDSPKIPGIDGTVLSINREVGLDVGESLFYRYYLILGTLADIQAKANKLESKVTLKKISVRPEQAKRLAICKDAGGTLKRTCEKDEGPLFFAYRDFVPDSRPLFLLRNARTGEQMVTSDPYEISFDPTDGLTKYVDFLGWAVPKAMAADSCRYQPLAEGINSMKQRPQLGRDTPNLYVLRPTSAACD